MLSVNNKINTILYFPKCVLVMLHYSENSGRKHAEIMEGRKKYVILHTKYKSKYVCFVVVYTQ